MIKKFGLKWGNPYSYYRKQIFITSTWVLLLSGCAFPNLAQVFPENEPEELLIEQEDVGETVDLNDAIASDPTLPDLTSIITHDSELLTVSPREPVDIVNWNDALFPVRISSAELNQYRLLPSPNRSYSFQLETVDEIDVLLTATSADLDGVEFSLRPVDPSTGGGIADFDPSQLLRIERDGMIGFFGLDSHSLWLFEVRSAEQKTDPLEIGFQPIDAFVALRLIEQGQALEEDGLLRFKVDVGEPTRLFITLQPDQSLDGILELYAQDGYINTIDEGDIGVSERIVYDAIQPGEYTIVVFGFESTAGLFDLEIVGFPLAELE